MVQENSLNQKPLLLIVGATASGKSELAMETAMRLHTSIVSCDSAQIYIGMDIGTAKPTVSEQRKVFHHLIDLVPPDTKYTVSDYCEDAKALICKNSEDDCFLFAGGTGLYVSSLLFGYNFSNATEHPKIREELKAQLAENGSDAMYERLREIDPVSAAETHANNTVRVLRALEIYYATGKRKSETADKSTSPIRKYAAFAIDWDRAMLYRRIDDRVNRMIDAGLVEEVQKLLALGYHRNLQSMQAIGYKETIEYLKGECSLKDAIETIKLATRHYAKRQITWFKKLPGLIWLQPDTPEKMSREILAKYRSLTV